MNCFHCEQYRPEFFSLHQREWGGGAYSACRGLMMPRSRRLTEMQVSSPAHWILRSSFLSLPSEVCVSIVFNVLATVADRLKSSPMFHSGNRALAINSPRRGNMLTTGINHDKAKFEPAAFLASAGLGKKVVDLKPDETFFCQGD